MIENYKEAKSAANNAKTQKDLLYVANLIEDLKADMKLTEKEHDELMELLQKKLG